MYANALEGSENQQFPFGTGDRSFQNDQSRVLTIDYKNNKKSKFKRPKFPTGGTGDEPAAEIIPGATVTADRKYNNGAFFCSHQCHLPGGSALIVGGTKYYQEGGALEIQGLTASRFFDYKLDQWVQTRDMNFGRWYPAVVPLANGDPFVVGGVFKLIKPVYTPPETPGDQDVFGSGDNVRQVERFDLKTGRWKVQEGIPAEKSLPLMPRIHLLPNGHVSYKRRRAGLQPGRGKHLAGDVEFRCDLRPGGEAVE